MTSAETLHASSADRRRWEAAPHWATALRFTTIALPLLAAWLAVYLASPHFYQPGLGFETLLWIVQALAVSMLASAAVDRAARKLLPLATLFQLSLVFPDRAPSRFKVALRTGTIRSLQARAADVRNEPVANRDRRGRQSDQAVELLAALAHHDRLTRGHSERVRAYSDLIAQEMGYSQHDRDLLAWGALLHDVGKLRIPNDILRKPSRLSTTETAIVQHHATAGQEILSELQEWLGPWMLAAAEHHERWDGSGYPLSLAGTDISMAGRIVAVADAFDVMTSTRSYKRPLARRHARRELLAGAGQQFDPAVVRAFLSVSVGPRWRAIGPLAPLLELIRSSSWIGTASAATMTSVATVSCFALTAPPSVHREDARAIEPTAETIATAPDLAPVALAYAAPASVEPRALEQLAGTGGVVTSSTIGAPTSTTTAPGHDPDPTEALAVAPVATTVEAPAVAPVATPVEAPLVAPAPAADEAPVPETTTTEVSPLTTSPNPEPTSRPVAATTADDDDDDEQQEPQRRRQGQRQPRPQRRRQGQRQPRPQRRRQGQRQPRPQRRRRRRRLRLQGTPTQSVLRTSCSRLQAPRGWMTEPDSS